MMAFLAAPAAKILAAVLGIAALVAGGYWLGYTRCDNSNKASIMEQALKANENMREANDNIARLRGELALTMERLVKKENDAIAIKERYAKSHEEKFVIGHQLELAVDALSRLHNATEDRVPAASEPTGRIAEPEAPPATSVALLGAYGECTRQLTRVLDRYYFPLVEAYRSSRKIALEGAGY